MGHFQLFLHMREAVLYRKENQAPLSLQILRLIERCAQRAAFAASAKFERIASLGAG